MSTYIIAEAGVNHNGDENLAAEMIFAAKEAGADAIKFQLFNASALTTKRAEQAVYQKNNCQEIESQYSMLKKLELSPESFHKLQTVAKTHEIDFIITPFDVENLHFIHGFLRLPLIKIGSGDATNGPLLLEAARTKAKIILSTGMCSLGEIEDALKILAFGYLVDEKLPSSQKLNDLYASVDADIILKEKVSLLHCTSEYPAPFNEVNLRAMETLRSAFGLNVGLSDHTMGFEVSLAAVALEATIIEKHFTLDKMMPGPDHLASLNVTELKAMIRGIRNIEQALGKSKKCATFSENKNAKIVRRSIVANQSIKQGDTFSNKNLAIKRPFDGISPMQYWDLLGKKAQKDYIEDEAIYL